MIGNSSLHISFHPIYQTPTPSHKIRIAIRNHRRDTQTITIRIRLNEAYRMFVTDSDVVRECGRERGGDREERNKRCDGKRTSLEKEERIIFSLTALLKLNKCYFVLFFSLHVLSCSGNRRRSSTWRVTACAMRDNLPRRGNVCVCVLLCVRPCFCFCVYPRGPALRDPP